MRSLAVALGVTAMVCVAAAQAPPINPPTANPIPQANSRLKSSEHRVTVTGCISGRRLYASDLETPDSVFETLRASEFALQGPRELLNQIKAEHDGHYDQITGIVNVPPATNGSSSTVTTKEFGKTRVTLSGREEGKAYTTDPPKTLTLKVATLTHLKEGCAAPPLRTR